MPTVVIFMVDAPLGSSGEINTSTLAQNAAAGGGVHPIANDSLFDTLRVRFDRAQSAILQSVDARSKNRLKFLANTLQIRKQQEIDDIGTVLDELKRAIQNELTKDQEPLQLSLFSEDERTQLKRDTAALEARLARIPAERIQEVQAIETRYAKFNDRTFPVAVVFLVPESAGGLA